MRRQGWRDWAARREHPHELAVSGLTRGHWEQRLVFGDYVVVSEMASGE